MPLVLQPIQFQRYKDTRLIVLQEIPKPILSINRHMIEGRQPERLEVVTGRTVSLTARPAGVVYWALLHHVYVSRVSTMYLPSSTFELH